MKLMQVDRTNLGGSGAAAPSGEAGDFSNLLSRLAEDIKGVAMGAQTASGAAALGGADLTQISTAVARAELMLETLVTIRDKLVGVYNDLVRTPL
ncbi:MAG: flagellar hook-basal body complex protein FliE [Alphaproteobacteria bacterium]|nr:flagellar hook-basal body complex protein FliE [Alphaproteobacteria bacterium]